MARPETKLDIRFVDSFGHPVPYVTVWGTTEPAGSAGNGREAPPSQQLSMADVWRIALRYKDSFELAQLGFSPVEGLTIIGMSNSKGIFQKAIDADAIHASVPSSYRVSLVFMKRDYLPAMTEIGASPDGHIQALNVEMKLGTGISGAAEPEYLKVFDRVRFEISDDGRNEALSEGNLHRLAALRAELANAADSALSAGDKKSAARILARMETMPSVTVIDGKVVGYSRMDLGAPESRDAIARAVALDPDDDYLAMRGLQERGRKLIDGFSHPMTDLDRERLRAFVHDLEVGIAAHGDHAWMFDRQILIFQYMRLGMYDKAYRELVRLREFEPHGADYDHLLLTLKRMMALDKAPVPTDWK